MLDLDLDLLGILDAVASGALPVSTARRALDFLLAEAHRAGELAGYTQGQAASDAEHRFREAAADRWMGTLFDLYRTKRVED